MSDRSSDAGRAAGDAQGRHGRSRSGGYGARRGGRPGGHRGGAGGADRGGRGRGADGRRSADDRFEAERNEPAIAEGLDPRLLDREVRARLRTLSKGNADRVAGHLLMAGMLRESDPERAYEHAQAAVRRAGRVDVVREAAALTAYATGRFHEALREVRTVRRLSGRDAHRAIEADCERGLGRPERALAVIAQAPQDLSVDERAELAMVASGARQDLGEVDAALAVLERVDTARLSPTTRERLAEARHDVLVRLGRAEPRSESVVETDDAEAEPDGDIVIIEDGLEST